MSDLKAYGAILAAFLIIDIPWIKWVAGPLYQREIGPLLRASPAMGAAGVFYLLYVGGILLLATRPAWRDGSVTTALVNGAVLGALAYGTYAMTNQAMLRGWTWTLAITDLAWGAAITAACAAAGYYAGR